MREREREKKKEKNMKEIVNISGTVSVRMKRTANATPKKICSEISEGQ